MLAIIHADVTLSNAIIPFQGGDRMGIRNWSILDQFYAKFQGFKAGKITRLQLKRHYKNNQIRRPKIPSTYQK